MTGPTSEDRTYRLEIPAAPEHVASARLFVSVVARGSEESDDIVEDAKLCVSEVVSAIIEGRKVPVVTIDASRGNGLILRVGPWHGEVRETEYGALDIAEALFPGSRVDGSWVVVPIEIEDDG